MAEGRRFNNNAMTKDYICSRPRPEPRTEILCLRTTKNQGQGEHHY